jgi:hypothetical protein
VEELRELPSPDPSPQRGEERSVRLATEVRGPHVKVVYAFLLEKILI